MDYLFEETCPIHHTIVKKQWTLAFKKTKKQKHKKEEEIMFEPLLHSKCQENLMKQFWAINNKNRP